MKKWIALLLTVLMLVSSAAAEGLPVYRAAVRTQQDANFFDKVDPAWFHQNEQVSYENGSKRARYDIFTFGDSAQLTIDHNVLCYMEYDGEYCMIYGEDPENPGGPFPRPSMAVETGWLAADARIRALYEGAEMPVLEHEALTGITLARAQATVQELLQKLNLSGYQLELAVDMSVDRIREWGVKQVEKHKTGYNVYDRYYDFSQATEADEGYFLVYRRMLSGLPVENPDGSDGVQAFVTAKGVAFLQLWDSYVPGEVYSTPEKLLTEAEIRAIFDKDNPRRIQDGFHDPAFVSATLKYCPMRADHKQDGMVLAPAWYIEYTFVDGSPSDGWAWYSAIDGRLIMDCYS